MLSSLDEDSAIVTLPDGIPAIVRPAVILPEPPSSHREPSPEDSDGGRVRLLSPINAQAQEYYRQRTAKPRRRYTAEDLDNR